MRKPKFCHKPHLPFWLCALLLCHQAAALPEDEAQEIVTEAASSEYFLDQGLYIHRGSSEVPARITQGSMIISGSEIRIEQADGRLLKVTATGTPARFQQQPAVDQAVVFVSGRSIVFDNVARTLAVDEEAEFSQAGNILNGHHIDYDLDARRANATNGSGTEPTRMTIPPAAGD